MVTHEALHYYSSLGCGIRPSSGERPLDQFLQHFGLDWSQHHWDGVDLEWPLEKTLRAGRSREGRKAHHGERESLEAMGINALPLKHCMEDAMFISTLIQPLFVVSRRDSDIQLGVKFTIQPQYTWYNPTWDLISNGHFSSSGSDLHISYCLVMLCLLLLLLPQPYRVNFSFPQ